MMQRRRFFPSSPVQQAPGRTVEFELQLQKSPKASSSESSTPPDIGGIVGPAVFPAVLEGGTFYDIPMFGLSGMQHFDYIYRPLFSGWRLVGGYVPILPAEQVSVFDVVIIGNTAQAVEWTWSLTVPELPPYHPMDPSVEGPVSWDGVDVVEREGTLRVSVLPGESPISGPSWWASLVCTARVGSEIVGKVVLRPGFLLDAFSIPTPE